jgi:hypothetical protein
MAIAPKSVVRNVSDPFDGDDTFGLHPTNLTLFSMSSCESRP